MTPKSGKQIHLGVRICGRAGFDSAAKVARSAERGLFDFVLVDDLTVLAALAAVTDRVGLAGTIGTADSAPFDAARRLATLDHLSDGRAGWTTATTGAAAAEFVSVVTKLWNSWMPGAVVADRDTGRYVDPDRIRAIDHHGPQFDVRGVCPLPTMAHGYPVLLQNLSTYASGGDTPAQIADEIDRRMQADGCDSVVLTPSGLEAFVDEVVPLLQQRGSFRSEYSGHTLREHLGL